MHVLSVNVSMGRTVAFDGGLVSTGIFKEPVAGPVAVGLTGLAGDRQSDLTVHGGEFKAVYAYSFEHYDWWRRALGRSDLAPGAFGENLTIADFDEEDVSVGDIFRIGDTRLVAVQPRLPCFKLGIRFGDMGMVKRFLESRRLGVYFRVAQPGSLQAGDAVERVYKAERRLSMPELERLRNDPAATEDDIRHALGASALAPNWQRALQARLTGDEGDE